jgi:hypothetical protein
MSLWFALVAGNLLAGTWAVPGVVNGTDGGNHWATELRIQNRDSKPIAVNLEFMAQAGETNPGRHTVVLDPGQTLIRKNLLREEWQLEDRRGALLVETGGAATVSAFRFTDTRDAVLGQALVATPSDEWLSGTMIGDLIWLAQSPEYESGVWVALGTDDARAEVVFFDAANKELARTMVEGTGRSRWLALSQLGIEGQPIVRARIRFLAGSGVGSGEIAHLPTGDRMGAGAVAVDQLQNDLSAHPAMRAPGFRTAMRLYNPLKLALAAGVTWNGKFASFPLAAGQVLQIDDVAEALKLEGDQNGVIRITAPSRMVAVLRMVRVNDDGSMGPGELLAPRPTIEVGGAIDPWLMVGIPTQSDSLFLSLRRGSVVSESKMTIEDQNGDQAAPPSETLSLSGATAHKLYDLLQLANLPALPPGATVSVAGQTGLMAPAVLGVLRGSGDIAHANPSRVVAETWCVGPSIEYFGADRMTLDVAGPVAFSWRTGQANIVRLSLDGQAREASGSANLTLAASGTVTLTASNSCGDVTRRLIITVGLPTLNQAKALAQTESGAGSPGQLVRFTSGNLGEPERVASILFRTPGGQTAEAGIEGVDSAGRVYALVPYIWLTGASRYAKGSVTASLVWDDGRVFGALPFQILPLTPPADPTGMFRTMLDSLASMAATADAELRSRGLTSFADAQKAWAAASGADLRKLADDLAVRGSGTLFYSSTTSGDTAASTSVTNQDLADLMAYELNLRDAESRLMLTPAPESAGKAGTTRELGGSVEAGDALDASETRAAFGTCIRDKETWIPVCQGLKFREHLEAVVGARAHEFARQIMADLPPDLEQQGEKAARDWVTKKLAQTALYAMAKRLGSYANSINLYCLIRPIELDKFELITTPPGKQPSLLKEVLYQLHDETPTKIQVNAVLTPHYAANEVRDKLISKEAEYIAKQFTSNKIGKTLAAAAAKAFIQTAQGDPELYAIEAIAKAANFKREQKYQVGVCDLNEFHPALPKPPGTKSAVRVASAWTQGEDDFFYRGSKMNTTADMCIVPKVQNFILSERVEAASKTLAERLCGFRQTVSVVGRAFEPAARDTARGTFLLQDFMDDLNVGPSEGLLRVDASVTAAAFGGAHPSGWTPNYSSVTNKPWVRQQSSGPASARVAVTKVGKNKWSFDATSTGDSDSSTSYGSEVYLDAELTIPESRSGTSQLKMDVKVQTLSGLCTLAAGVANTVKGEGGNNFGNGVSESSPRILTYSLSAEDASRSASLTLQIFASGGIKPATSCRATGMIELTLPEE